MPPTAPRREDFPAWTADKVRYGDTDRQGHVNNAVFATFLETGRVEILYGSSPLADSGASFVIARLSLDFLGEIRWPGSVETGTRVVAVGKSSVTLAQALFQEGRPVAVAETVIVQTDEQTRKSRPLSAAAVDRLRAIMASASG